MAIDTHCLDRVCIGKTLVAALPLDESSIFCRGCDELTITHNAAKNLTLLFNANKELKTSRSCL